MLVIRFRTRILTQQRGQAKVFVPQRHRVQIQDARNIVPIGRQHILGMQIIVKQSQRSILAEQICERAVKRCQ